MTLFLRNKQGKNIVDVEVYKTTIDEEVEVIEVSSTIIIRNYSELLLKSLLIRGVNLNPENVVNDFEKISKFRKWIYESYLQENPHATKEEVVSKLRDKLKKIADKYDLQYIED